MSGRTSQKSATIWPSDATSVGIRDLRDHLSAYLERVKAGESLTITEHGRPIARVIGLSGYDRLQELIDQGLATPAVRPFDPSRIRRVRLKGSTDDLIDWVRGGGED